MPIEKMAKFFMGISLFILFSISGLEIIPISGKCTKTGVELNLAPNVRQVRVCVRPICLEKSDPDALEKFDFPKPILLYSQEIDISYWVGDTKLHYSMECEAQHACDLIDFWNFWEFIANPYCAPILVFFTICALAYIGLSIIYTTLKMMCCVLNGFLGISKILWKISTILLRIFWFVGKKIVYVFKKVRKTEEKRPKKISVPNSLEDCDLIDFCSDEAPLLEVKTRKQIRRRSSLTDFLRHLTSTNTLAYSLALSGIIFCCIIPTLSMDCSETESFIADSGSCEKVGSELLCKISTSRIITIPPHGQTICFLVKDHEGNPIGSIEMKFGEIAFHCDPVTHHFTRDFLVKHYDAKMCAKEGSCRDTRCADLRPYDRIPELEVVQNKPGFNRCTESCGFWSCGCGLPTAGCLFYRIYAEETMDKNPYEIGYCPFWTTHVPIETTIVTNNATEKFVMDLIPGETYTRHGLRATLASQITPHANLLNSYFLSNGSHMALMADDELENSKLFWCQDFAVARDFNGTLPYDICNCMPAERRMNCACKTQKFTKSYENGLLPLVLPAMVLKSNPQVNQIEAQVLQNAAIQVQLSFKKFELLNYIDKTMCYAKVASAGGCYKCQEGMELVIDCSAEHDGALAHISCDNVDFYLTCSRETERHKKRLQIAKAFVSANCSTTCTAGTSYFGFNTTLYYLPHTGNGLGWANGPGGIAPPPGIDYEFLWNWIIADWKRIGCLLAVVLLAIAVPFSSLCGCCCCLWVRPIKNKVF